MFTTLYFLFGGDFSPASAPPPPPPPSPPPPPPPPVANGPRPPLVFSVDAVDDDTEAAILLVWHSAGDVEPVVCVDADTEAAIVAAWRRDVQLPQLFSRDPTTGRLKSLAPGADVQADGPYAVLDCQQGPRPNERFQQGGALVRNDYRRVTITVYGVRADVVAAVRLVQAIFNRKLGVPQIGGAPFAYPSGARFVRYMPLNDGIIKQDETTKAGRDVWQGIIEGEVWSVRTE